MKITKIEPFLLHVPVTGSHIADSKHQVTHWGVPGVVLRTDSGLAGFGYTGTHAHLATDRLIIGAIAHTYGPLLVGEEASNIDRLWHKLHMFPPALWVGRAGILKLALAAVDVALWDLRAKEAGMPLWRLLGDTRPDGIEAYNTNCGWLSIPTGEMVDGCRRMVEQDGWRALKLKVGSADPLRDLDRVRAVRKAVGNGVRLMVDVNGAWELPVALEYAPRLAEFDVAWIEEPLWYDDTAAHACLAAAITTPVALGEQLYSLDAFRHFIDLHAVHYVQPDAVRLGGITEWLRVADLAQSRGLPVAPHAGDMSQIHWHLSLAHPACEILEYIPWLRECFEEPVAIREGRAIAPSQVGAGTTLRADACQRFGVSLRHSLEYADFAAN